MRKSGWLRALCVLLVAVLVPIAPVGGFGSTGIAKAETSVNGLIELYESYVYGNEIRIYWSIDGSGSFDQEISLFRLPEETELSIEPNETSNSYNGGHIAKALDPGTYRFVLKLLSGGAEVDKLVHEFVMPGPETRFIHIFGTEQPIDDLEFRQTFPASEVPLYATAVLHPGKGFVTYAVEILPNGCFELESATYSFSNSGPLCADRGWEFMVHASESDELVDLIYFSMDEEQKEGFLSGFLSFKSKSGQNEFTMMLIDRSGSSQACAMDGFAEIGWEFNCPLSADPAYLQLNAVINGTPIPTDVIIHLIDVQFPGDVNVIDRDRRVDRIDPQIVFEGIPNESGIALYKIMPTQTSGLPTGVRYIPAEGGPYSFEMPGIEPDYFDLQYVTIQVVDTDGNLYAAAAKYPLIDNMAEEVERIDYSLYGLETLEQSFTPADATFEDDDLSAGGRAGTVAWTIPASGDYELTAYDLYYVGSNENLIRGEARVYVSHTPLSTFEHMLEDVPADAAYLEVVPLVREWVEPFYYIDYNAESFLIKLNDRVMPMLDELLVNGSPVYPQQANPSQYEYIAAWNADVVTVTASSAYGVVYVGNEGPAATVTTAVYLDNPVSYVPIRVGTPEGDWTSDYDLVITKEAAPDAPKLASITVNGQQIAPAGSFYSISVTPDVSFVTVSASADANVEIELMGSSGYGSVEVVIPITEDEMIMPIRLYDSAAGVEAVYTLQIIRDLSVNLVLDVRSGWLDGDVYRFVPKWMTAGELKEQFVTVDGTVIEVRDGSGNPVADMEPVPVDARVYLSRLTTVQVIKLYMLSEHLRSTLNLPSGGPIAFPNIAVLAIHDRIDVTGDGVFNQQDVRRLLLEMD